MDQWWKKLPLFMTFLLFLSNAYGIKGGASSNAQLSDNTFSPPVQSSVLEVPVYGNLPEEVGSSLFANRPLKRLNLLQFVKGHVSSRPESTSHVLTVPSSSVLASLPQPLNEQHAGSLTSLQGSSGSTIINTASVSALGENAVLGTSGLSTSNQSSPSLSSSLETFGAKSAEDPFPVFSQESISYSSSSTPGAIYTSQGSPVPLSEGSGQSISPQGQSSYSSLSLSQGASSPYIPDSYNKLSSSSVSSQSTNVQSSPSVSTSTQTRSGTPLTTSSYFFPLQGGSRSTSTLSLKPQGFLGPYSPASLTKCASVPMSPHPAIYSQSTSSSGAQLGTSSGFDLQGISNIYSGSVPSQGTVSQSATVQSPRKQFTSSFGTQKGPATPFNLQGTTTYGGSLQPQGTTSPFAPGSPSSYPSVSLSSPQGAASQSSWKQFISRFGIQSGFPTPVSLQGSTSGGSLQHQGTTSQFAPGSPSSYPSVSISTPQGAASQSATVQSSTKQFTSTFRGSSGTQEGPATPFNLQGSSTYGGSLQPQDTTSLFATGSPSSYPSVSISTPQGAASQSSRKQFISSFGIQSGFSTPLSLQGSTTSGGSLQYQDTTSQFAPGSPSSYPRVSISTPQGAASQSSRKQFTSSFGIQSGFSTPLSLQGSTTSGGSLQHQDTTSQFAPGSPSSYPRVSISTPQGAASQSSWKQFISSFGIPSGFFTPLSLQGSTTYGGSLQHQGTTSQFAPGSPSSYPRVSISTPQGAASQSSRKQFTSSFGIQSGFSTPLSLQGSTTSGGSLQHQDTTSRFAPGSPSSYPSVSISSPQGAASQSSWKPFISRFGIQSGFSTPLSLQGSTTSGGALQHQDTTSQFAPGSPSSYPSVSLLPQGFASQPSQALQSYSVSLNQKSQRWPPSEGIQTSGAAESQGSSLSQISPMQGSFSSLSLAGGSSSGNHGLFASAQGGGSRSYAKLVSLPLAGSDVQLYKVSSNSRANAYPSPQMFSSYGAPVSQAFRAVAL